jgi:hypothetical protein
MRSILASMLKIDIVQSNAKKVDKNLLFYFINVAFLIPASPHYFCIRLGNQEYSRSQLPTKMEKLEDWTKQPKTSCLLFFAFDCRFNVTRWLVGAAGNAAPVPTTITLC